jgi:RNA 2',3'-cyclic 3'-phosphodiesterase
VIRSFLAVELSDVLRGSLAAIQQDLQKRVGPDLPKTVRLSWVPPASMHLTLKFFGMMDEGLVDPLRVVLQPLVNGHFPISVPLERLAAFPRIEQPRVLWIGPPPQWEQAQDAKRLALLHRIIEESCESFGFAAELRPFSPHLTLARIRQGERQVGSVLARHGAIDRPLTLSLQIASIALMKSEPSRSGSMYTRLWEIGSPVT